MVLFEQESGCSHIDGRWCNQTSYVHTSMAHGVISRQCSHIDGRLCKWIKVERPVRVPINAQLPEQEIIP